MNAVNGHAPIALSADVLATRAKTVVDQLAVADWKPLQDLREALQCYSEVRLGIAMAEQSAEVLAVCHEPAPVTERSVCRG